MPLKGGKVCVGRAEGTVSICFATLGKRWAWGTLVSMEDHAWVVIVFPLEMTVVSVNTAGDDFGHI